MLDFLKKAQDEGLRFWQTRSHVIILYDSAPVDCIERVMNTEVISESTTTSQILSKEA